MWAIPQYWWIPHYILIIIWFGDNRTTIIVYPFKYKNSSKSLHSWRSNRWTYITNKQPNTRPPPFLKLVKTWRCHNWSLGSDNDDPFRRTSSLRNSTFLPQHYLLPCLCIVCYDTFRLCLIPKNIKQYFQFYILNGFSVFHFNLRMSLITL